MRAILSIMELNGENGAHTYEIGRNHLDLEEQTAFSFSRRKQVRNKKLTNKEDEAIIIDK